MSYLFSLQSFKKITHTTCCYNNNHKTMYYYIKQDNIKDSLLKLLFPQHFDL